MKTRMHTVSGDVKQRSAGHGLHVEVCLVAQHTSQHLPRALDVVRDQGREALEEHERQDTSGLGDRAGPFAVHLVRIVQLLKAERHSLRKEAIGRLVQLEVCVLGSLIVG